MKALGGKGFWGLSKPYCSFCHWNVALAREGKRRQLKQLLLSPLIFAAFFGAVAYFAKEEFALFPFLFICIFVLVTAIASRKELRVLETSHSAATSAPPLTSLAAAQEKAKLDREAAFEHLRALQRPRHVRLKSVPMVISFAFPASLVLFAYFGFVILRNGGVSSGMLRDLVPLLIIVGIWSVLSVVVMRRAWKDRRLLQNGDLAIATVTNQELTGGRHPRSRITYEFKDASGLKIHSEKNDDSRTLYEEMETPVFYNPGNTADSVPLVCASCELKKV